MQKAQRQKTKWIVSDVPQAPRVPRKHEPLIGSSTPGPFQGHLLYPFIIIFYPSCIFVQHWHCLTQSGDADRKRGLRLPAYPSIVFQVFSGIYWSLRIWNGIWWLLMQRAKVLCDVSQQEVLEEEMSICRLLGPKAMDWEVVAAVAFQDFKLACNPLVFRSFPVYFSYFVWNYAWKQWCVAMKRWSLFQSVCEFASVT